MTYRTRALFCRMAFLASLISPRPSPPKPLRSKRRRSPTAFAKWKMVWINSANISTTEETTPRIGQTPRRAAEQLVGAGRSNSTDAQARGNQARQTKDDLEDAMDDLNRTTNRLRRKFDPTSNYLETKAQMDQVMDGPAASIK